MRIVSALLAFLLFTWHGGAALLQLSEGAWYTGIAYGFFEPELISEADYLAASLAYENWNGPVLLLMAGLRGVAAFAMLTAAAFTFASRRAPALLLCGIAFLAHVVYAPLALWMLWNLEIVYGTAFLDDWGPLLGDAVYDWTAIRHAWVPWIVISLLSSPVAALLIGIGTRPVQAEAQ